MRKNTFILTAIIALIAALPMLTLGADEDGFGNRLNYDHYAGIGAIIPKDKDFDIAPAFTYGMQWHNEKETVFLDFTFSETQASENILWLSGDVRHTIIRLGYKQPVTKSRNLLLGADVQTHHMDFGSRKMTAVTLAALAEYKFTNSWSIQIESAQKTKKSGVYFGNFTASVIKGF